MPTENERKYILSLHSEREVSNFCQEKFKFIKQGYLFASKGTSLRIREIFTHKPNKSVAIHHEICYKQKITGRVIEIEKKIDERDFNDLWKNAINKLEKFRYTLEIDTLRNEEKWEIDYFKDDKGNTYFALAEHEMPEEMKEPRFIPFLVNKYLMFDVGLKDDRFSSRKLADKGYAVGLIDEISNNKLENDFEYEIDTSKKLELLIT